MAKYCALLNIFLAPSFVLFLLGEEPAKACKVDGLLLSLRQDSHNTARQLPLAHADDPAEFTELVYIFAHRMMEGREEKKRKMLHYEDGTSFINIVYAHKTFSGTIFSLLFFFLLLLLSMITSTSSGVCW
jgi:hypothetical protein